jgi:cytochrome c553
MPSTPGLTPQLAEALLRYIEQKSEGTGAAPPEPTPAFTKADVVRGRALFTGAVRTAQGAPACITCHAAADRGGLAGGGRLGRDLTQVSVRLRGPAGVARWLESPPTPMMRALVRRAPLTADENRALTAFFEDLRTRPESSANRQMGRLAAAGVVGALLGLAAIAGAWRGRLRSVRRPLVERCAASLRTGGDS